MTTGAPPAEDTVERLNRILSELGVDCRAGYRHGREFYVRCRTPEGLVRVGYLTESQLAEEASEVRRRVREVVGDLMPPGWIPV